MIRTIMAALALAFTLPAISAHAAARDRVFVASYGSDSNPCTFGSPCKTFQQAVNVVANKGEVTAIDSAGFGPISIGQSVTITSPNGVEAGIQAAVGGNAITINAGSTDRIILRGLTLEGAGVAYNGIVFNSGASLTVADCVVQNFAFNGSDLTTGNGILIQPSSGAVNFAINNSTFSNNGFVGIYYLPPSGSATTNGVIDHVVTTGNAYGIAIDTKNGTGSTTFAISNSIASNSAANTNSTTGIYIANVSAPLSVSIDSCNISGNDNGVWASGTPKVLLGRSVITSNSVNGLNNGTAPNTFYSFQNNQIYLNGNNNAVNGSTPVALPFQ
jgi:hypothetical protein